MSIEKIINEWDPISLFPLAPADEYHYEINLVRQAVSCCLNANELGDELFRIFSNSFGDLFVKTKQECFNIANELLMQIG